MKARLKRYEQVNGQWVKIQSEPVEFICITTDRSAKIIDSTGKPKTVRRSSLLDVPDNILWPNIPIVAQKVYDDESMRKAFYYD